MPFSQPPGPKYSRDSVSGSQGNPFRSFWMGGFECSDQLNAFGNRVDLLDETGHLELIDRDYASLATLGIRTVREGIRWSRVESKPFEYDWKIFTDMLKAAEKHRIQQVWDLCHFGFPEDITPLHPMFARRFAALCTDFAKAFRKQIPDGPLIVTPINEVGFLSWLGGDVRGTSPYCFGQGWEVKYALMRAYIEGIHALKAEDPNVRILTTEPLVNIAAAEDASELERYEAAVKHENQFQAMDILGGKLCPELGGSPDLLDIIGVNYYYNNQWLDLGHQTLGWNDKTMHPRWKPLHLLLEEVHKRYNRPIVISETSHPHEDRPIWMRSMACECRAALKAGIPLWGVCWYPIIDRPDWDHLDHWHRSGIWDHQPAPSEKHGRVLHEVTAAAFLEAQRELAPYHTPLSQTHRFRPLGAGNLREQR